MGIRPNRLGMHRIAAVPLLARTRRLLPRRIQRWPLPTHVEVVDVLSRAAGLAALDAARGGERLGADVAATVEETIDGTHLNDKRSYDV